MCHKGVVDAAHEPLMVWPARANLHDFRAVTPCAFIDVQAPPYGERDCRWYATAEKLEVGKTVELQETEAPYTPFVHTTYRGPAIRSGSKRALWGAPV